MEELNKLDIIVERTGASYKEASKALQDAQGDILEAVLAIDNQATSNNRSTNQEQTRQRETGEQEQDTKKQHQKKRRSNRFQVGGDQLVAKVKELLKQGNVTRIIINKEGQVLVDIPVTAGVVGVILAPYLSAVAAIAAVASQYDIKVERR
ncbi:DUF4342 domain-containing protein [Halanaerobaculum tunisiense]